MRSQRNKKAKVGRGSGRGKKRKMIGVSFAIMHVEKGKIK